MSKKRVLIVYYSFSGQTQLLIQRLVCGLEQSNHEVVTERLQPVDQLPFPFTSWAMMAKVMVYSFFRWRVPVNQVNDIVYEKWDLVIIAGPTWSYSPSGPVLAFLDKYGRDICEGTTIVPFISCRSYWRTHYWGLKFILNKLGGKVTRPIVYLHCSSEPWRTIGLFLQLMGKLPRLESSWFRRRYPRYGHSKEQCADALEQGKMMVNRLMSTGDMGK